jgi:hypothetical protein
MMEHLFEPNPALAELLPPVTPELLETLENNRDAARRSHEKRPVFIQSSPAYLIVLALVARIRELEGALP